MSKERVINMTQRTKCTCQLIVGITGSVMGVAAWVMSVAETAFDRMLARRLKL